MISPPIQVLGLFGAITHSAFSMPQNGKKCLEGGLCGYPHTQRTAPFISSLPAAVSKQMHFVFCLWIFLWPSWHAKWVNCDTVPVQPSHMASWLVKIGGSCSIYLFRSFLSHLSAFKARLKGDLQSEGGMLASPSMHRKRWGSCPPCLSPSQAISLVASEVLPTYCDCFPRRAGGWGHWNKHCTPLVWAKAPSTHTGGD